MIDVAGRPPTHLTSRWLTVVRPFSPGVDETAHESRTSGTAEKRRVERLSVQPTLDPLSLLVLRSCYSYLVIQYYYKYPPRNCLTNEVVLIAAMAAHGTNGRAPKRPRTDQDNKVSLFFFLFVCNIDR